MNSNEKEPEEGTCRFSIQADPAAINLLGSAFETFCKLQHLEIRWSPTESELVRKVLRLRNAEPLDFEIPAGEP